MASDASGTPLRDEPTMSGRRLALIIAAPLLLLVGVIALFVLTAGAGLNVRPVVPSETVQFERTVLKPGVIELHIRNTSPQDIAIRQVNVNDATWPYAISPNATLPRLGTAVVTLSYPWVEGEPYEISLFTGSAVVLTTEVPAASTTPTASTETLWSFTLIGIYVGVLPVVLGMLWLPALRRLGRRVMLFLMAATVGLLLYLGINAGVEAVEQAGELAGPLQGFGIAAVGLIGTVLLLDAIGRRQLAAQRSDAGRRTSLATMVAVGIGLHNLGEGLAIGAAYSVGAAALGAFLVIGFIVQNVTEGLGIVVPLAGDRPRTARLAVLALVAGGPAILGAWIGGLLSSPLLAVLFLDVGAGAVFQVAYQIGRHLVWPSDERRQMPVTAFSGAMSGMLVLYLTGLAVK